MSQVAKAKRARKRNLHQREMLLPIAGGRPSEPVAPATRITRGPPGPPPLGARTLGMLDTLKYLIREWEDYGVIDATNMRHVYWAVEANDSPTVSEFLPFVSSGRQKRSR
jgi:hypothetical protein